MKHLPILDEIGAIHVLKICVETLVDTDVPFSIKVQMMLELQVELVDRGMEFLAENHRGFDAFLQETLFELLGSSLRTENSQFLGKTFG